MMRRCLLMTILLLCGMYTLAQQTQSDFHRKKVAVVLSGGGAKGMAHIGVLKVIERAGIPVDYIVGTSMGSIVGGLYAIGYDAHKLDSMVRCQDWTFLLTDKVNRKDQDFEGRERQDTYLLSVPLRKKKGQELSGGLIQGQNLSNLFAKLTVGYHDSINFATLPIPFACVATNLVNNTEVDMYSGWLSTAMRASMSIPGVFSPVRKDSMILVDGGLRNNYPVDIARRMGADVVIGVSVQSDQKTADELRGGTDIIMQLVDVNCMNKYKENWAATDVPIKVNVKGYSSMSFAQGAIDTLIQRGETAAMSHWNDLIALKKVIGIDSTFVPQKPYLYHMSGLKTKIKLIALDFTNIDESDRNFIVKRFHLNEGDSISGVQIEQTLTALRGDLFYTDASYQLRPMAGGYWLSFNAKDKKISEVYLGVRFDNEEMVALQASSNFQFHSRIPVELAFTGRLGKRSMARIDASFNPPLLKKLTLSYMYRYNDVNIYSRGKRDYNISYNYNMFDLAFLNFSGRNFLIDLTARYELYHFDDLLSGKGSLDVDLGNQHYISYHFKEHFNSQDREYFTAHGAKFEAGYSLYSDNFVEYKNHNPFSVASGRWQIACQLNSHLVLQPMLYGRIVWGRDIPLCQYNVVGSEMFGHYLPQQLPFAGINNVEYMGNTFIGCQLRLQQRIMDNNYVSFALSAGQTGENFKNVFDETLIRGYRLSYSYDSLFGPLSASLGYSSRTKKAYLFINLGYDF
jgi:NTE family protein